MWRVVIEKGILNVYEWVAHATERVRRLLVSFDFTIMVTWSYLWSHASSTDSWPLYDLCDVTPIPRTGRDRCGVRNCITANKGSHMSHHLPGIFCVGHYMLWRLNAHRWSHKHERADYDYCRFSVFYLSIESLILGIKCVFKHQDLQRKDLKIMKYEYFSHLKLWVAATTHNFNSFMICFQTFFLKM